MSRNDQPGFVSRLLQTASAAGVAKIAVADTLYDVHLDELKQEGLILWLEKCRSWPRFRIARWRSGISGMQLDEGGAGSGLNEVCCPRYVPHLMAKAPRRKYFLDWLRVIAFVVLIVFHTGLLYSTWHYNLKSPRIFPNVEWALLALTPWRLALLFFISGVASYHLLAKLGRGAFARDRLRRLLPVILVGMFIVIPPQTYVELVDKGVLHTGYFEFWFGSYLAADQSLVAPFGKTMPTWDHLWFIVYLLAYLLILALVAPVAHLANGRRWPTVRFSVVIVAPAIWLAFAEVMIERYAPLTHAFANDWGGHLKWIGMLITGLVCATRPDFWDWCLRKRARLAALAALAFAVQSACRAWALAGGVEPLVEDVLLALASGVYAWSVICALCGYAAQYLDTPSRQLSHLNEAILPVYVLHQPILLIAAWLLFPLRLPLLIEAGILIIVALLGSLAMHELLIRPWPLVRPLFGLKSRLAPGARVAKPPSAAPRRAG